MTTAADACGLGLPTTTGLYEHVAGPGLPPDAQAEAIHTGRG